MKNLAIIVCILAIGLVLSVECIKAVLAAALTLLLIII